MNDAQALPRSDTIAGNLPEQFKSFRWDLPESLDYLARANFLFSFELGGALRYIVAEPPVLQRLGSAYRERLEQAYEREYYRRRAAEAIIKELTPRLASIRNVELSETLNICVLLLQYENSLAVNYQEFSDHRKESALREILATEGFSDGEQIPGSTAKKKTAGPELGAAMQPPGPAIPDPKMPGYEEKRKAPELPPEPAHLKTSSSSRSAQPAGEPIAAGRRAVESDEYRALEKMEPRGRWEKASAVYGVQFLLRVHFRKCEFNMVSGLVRAGKIQEREDLEYIRETITMMLANLKRDPCLAAHVEQMQALREITDLRLAES